MKINNLQELTREQTEKFLNKWKDLIENGEPLYDITVPGYGTFTNCRITQDDNFNFTVHYDEYKGE